MLLGTILSRTFALARRFWKRLLGVWALTSIIGGVFAVWAQTTAAGGGPSFLAVLLSFVVLLVVTWGALAGVRVPLHNDEVGEALGEALAPTPKLFASSLILLATVVPTLLVLPHVVLLGAIAAERPGLGLAPALRLGIGRFVRNIGIYVALLLVVAVIAVLAGVLFAAAVVAAAGVPGAGDLGSVDALTRYGEEAWAGVVVGGVLAALPVAVLWPCFVAATWTAMQEREDALTWRDEDLEPVQVTQELSPAVASLLGSGPAGARPRPRMRVPPRAVEPGRLPGPGVLTVADLALPPGAATRPVDSPTLELDAFDAAPSSTPGTVVASAAEALWITARPYDAAPAAWRQLGAGFTETGLWPLLLPAASSERAPGAPWYEQRARRERDVLDATAQELLRARLEGSLRDSPLSSTELIAASALHRGELAHGSGRRTDAIAQAFDELGRSHLGLVPVRRPADAVHRIAWPGTAAAGITGIELAEVLASWEERWGALLVGLTDATLVLAVLRPPATMDEAVEAAAEHHATCPDEAEEWGDDRTYARSLVDAPVWRLSWS